MAPVGSGVTTHSAQGSWERWTADGDRTYGAPFKLIPFLEKEKEKKKKRANRKGGKGRSVYVQVQG